MATYILKWNPAFSSYRTVNYLSYMDWLIAGSSADMNWSVWEYEHIKEGDKVYMLKVGNGPSGIVMEGLVTSKAYRDEDWAGKNRKTYYVDFYPTVMIAPDCAPILDSATLQNAIPDFDWWRGHSGARLTPEQAAILDDMWQRFLKDNFPSLPESKAPLIYVRPQTPRSEPLGIDRRAVMIGEQLYRYVNDRLQRRDDYDYELQSNMRNIMETVSWLLDNYPQSPAAAYSNLECARQIPWRSRRYTSFLRKAQMSLLVIKENGGSTSVNLDEVKERLKKREAFAHYIFEAEDKAEEGRLMDDLRDLIDGYDLINGKMGSFHDSELQSVTIDHLKNYIELKIYMCNGADHILTLRFEGHIEYDIDGDGDCVCLYLYEGYFYRYNNRVCLDINPLGRIEADRVRVISFTPAPKS